MQLQQMKWITVVCMAYVQNDFEERVQYANMPKEDFHAITRMPLDKLRRKLARAVKYLELYKEKERKWKQEKQQYM